MQSQTHRPSQSLPGPCVAIPAGIIRTGDVMADAMSSLEQVPNAPEVDANPLSLEYTFFPGCVMSIGVEGMEFRD